ncbi:stage II sporulation protein P [Oikeobacillus pervagus]|uniref:Stage II sporulation protein P n=1 Tax=Oikeobacillus pervagus TaxID=1325931 RepID=A0AAJ1T4I6_9BACI|nr:stage II sporulation protein P [Oikeobacillus pervagus]MDQ0214670.1 stage II sporulation protein P [Oikeobacillus pervagus]
MIKGAFQTVLSIIIILFIIAAVSFSGIKISDQNLFDKDELKSESLIYLMSLENHHLSRLIPNYQKTSVVEAVIKFITSINLKDQRSLLISEISGLENYNSTIFVAGRGTDFTNLPIETPPHHEMRNTQSDHDGNHEQKENIQNIEGEGKIYIYHSHNRESFLPVLDGVKNPNLAHDPDKNVTLLGKRLSDNLREKGIQTIVDTTDIYGVLMKRGLKYPSSYNVSREFVQAFLKENDRIQMMFDIHRDARPKKVTTTTINQLSYARLFFVVGVSHPNYEENLKFAKTLNHELEKKYPGISRGVFGKSSKEGNGVYNQDLLAHSVIIEVGGYENNMEELNRTIDALSGVISDYYWQEAKEVQK